MRGEGTVHDCITLYNDMQKISKSSDTKNIDF